LGAGHSPVDVMAWHPTPDELPLIADRFWRKVRKGEPHECWEWFGARHARYGSNSYGHMAKRINGKVHYARAHRVALLLSGCDVKPTDLVLHSCDNPGCVNPAHLRVGTFTDNMRDRASRQPETFTRGERNRGGGKLTNDDVRLIRHFLKNFVPRKDVAAIFSVSPSLIEKIAQGRIWKCA
jgi:hypothetical protein